MRSRMAADLAGHCPRCYLRTAFCVCSRIPSVPTRTRFIVLRHAAEAYKSTNSARWAQLALPRCEMWRYTGRGSLEPQLRALGPAWLLFPSDAEPPRAEPGPAPEVVVVLDGTWRQVRRMLNHSPQLLALPRLALTVDGPRGPALRQSHFPEGRSTLEAMALALSQLEGPEVARPLFELHACMVEGVQRGRGSYRAPLLTPPE